MIEIKNLVKRYGELVALDHLNLEIQEGEIFGLLGPNGSGKTTAINCLLALLKYDKGSIRIFGEEMRPDNYKVKQQIGIVLQNVAVFEEMHPAPHPPPVPHLLESERPFRTSFFHINRKDVPASDCLKVSSFHLPVSS